MTAKVGELPGNGGFAMGVTLSPSVTIQILELLGEGIPRPHGVLRSGKCWEEGGDRVTGETGRHRCEGERQRVFKPGVSISRRPKRCRVSEGTGYCRPRL